jgi:hypothetical protein
MSNMGYSLVVINRVSRTNGFNLGLNVNLESLKDVGKRKSLFS